MPVGVDHGDFTPSETKKDVGLGLGDIMSRGLHHRVAGWGSSGAGLSFRR